MHVLRDTDAMTAHTKGRFMIISLVKEGIVTIQGLFDGLYMSAHVRLTIPTLVRFSTTEQLPSRTIQHSVASSLTRRRWALVVRRRALARTLVFVFDGLR